MQRSSKASSLATYPTFYQVLNLALKSTQNSRKGCNAEHVLKFEKSRDLESHKQDFIECEVSSMYSGMIVVKIQDPPDLRTIQDPQDSATYFLSEIQDL